MCGRYRIRNLSLAGSVAPSFRAIASNPEGVRTAVVAPGSSALEFMAGTVIGLRI
jgi:hypothetical protein